MCKLGTDEKDETRYIIYKLLIPNTRIQLAVNYNSDIFVTILYQQVCDVI